MIKKIAVLLSGNGTNLNAIINNGIKVSFVASDNPDAPGLKIAKDANIPIFISKSLSKLESEVMKLIKKNNVELLVLAGFMRLLSEEFVSSLPEKFIINIHPSILPAFKGLNAIEQSLKCYSKKTGVTIHYVDEGMDSGPIIKQVAVKIYKNDTLKSLSRRLHSIEYELYPKVIKQILNNLDNQKISLNN